MITRPSVGSAGLMVVDTAAGPIAVDAVVRLDGCCQIIRSQCLSSNSLLRRLEEMRSLEGRKDLGRGLVSLVGASVASMRVSGDAMLWEEDGWMGELRQWTVQCARDSSGCGCYMQSRFAVFGKSCTE